jgi:hypothetical protein
VPEPAACGCIRIEAGDSEALGAGGRPRPSEVRRLVAAFTAEAVIRRQNVVLGKVVAVLKATAPDARRVRGVPRSPWTAPRFTVPLMASVEGGRGRQQADHQVR